MYDILTLQVKDGPQIGQEINVPSDKTSLGGKGSGSEIELSGIPHGVQFAELKVVSGKWTIAEFQPRSILLNGRQLKRKNILKSGDEIQLPSLKKGQSIRYKLDLVAQKKQKSTTESSGPKVKPLYLALGVSYVMLMVMVGLYFVVNGSNNSEPEAEIGIVDVTSALNEDIAAIDMSVAIDSGNIALSNTPANFEELKKFLLSDMDAESKLAVQNSFKQRILKLFSEAWRLERQGRNVDAKEQYEKVLKAMAGRDLATPAIAMKRLNELN